jgi:hypothetical protein
MCLEAIVKLAQKAAEESKMTHSPANDLAGRPWAKLSEVRVGSSVVADGGFTCLDKGVERVVQQDSNGKLFIRCGGSKRSGVKARHYLDGQADDGEHLVGLYQKEAKP